MSEFIAAFLNALGTVPHDEELIAKQLERVPSSTFDSLSSGAANMLAYEWAGEAVRAMQRRRTGPKVVRGQDVSNAARRIGVRINRGRGEFSALEQSDRIAMIAGCPWC